MRQKFYETDQFKQIEQDWYERLHTVGFKDCEKMGWLTQSAVFPFRHHPTQGLREAVLHYYLFISQGVVNEIFKNPRDAKVMEMRAQGARIKDIVLALHLDGYQIHRQTVRYIIRRFEAKWKIRAWRKEQMSSNRATG